MIYTLIRILDDNYKSEKLDGTEEERIRECWETMIFADNCDVYFYARFMHTGNGINNSFRFSVPHFSHEGTAMEKGARKEGFMWMKLPVKDAAEFAELTKTFDNYRDMFNDEYKMILDAGYMQPVIDFLEKAGE